MSHVATVQLQIRDPEALAAVCARLGFPTAAGEVRFYDGTSAAGIVIQLPGWRYGVVVDAQARLHYDNYGGQWGDLAELHRFRQAYTKEAATRWAQREGYPVLTSERTADGWIRLELQG